MAHNDRVEVGDIQVIDSVRIDQAFFVPIEGLEGLTSSGITGTDVAYSSIKISKDLLIEWLKAENYGHRWLQGLKILGDPQKHRTMAPLQIATWEEYQGCARVRYHLIDIHPEKRKFFLEKDAKWWEKILKNDKCHSDEFAHAPIIMVSKGALEDARRRSHSSSNGQGLPALAFREGEMLCLDGQSRIRAALHTVVGPGTSGFGAVHIVLDSINDAQRNEILFGFCKQIPPDCSQLYAKIRNSENFQGRHKNKMSKSTLGRGLQQGLTTLRNCERLSDALDKVVGALPTIAHGFPFGKVKAYHATLCEYSIERYLVGYIFGFWEGVVSKSQLRSDGSNQPHIGDIPSEVFEKLQGLMPGVSEDDRAIVQETFSRPAVFASLSGEHRILLKDSILMTCCLIPSMTLFAGHMRFLEKASISMKKLLGLDEENRKRGQGCVRPLEDVMKGLYLSERNVHDRYQIQTTGGWRTIYAPFANRQELSCRQLWLFVMRHDDPAVVDQEHLAYMAKQLGFYSSLIEERAAAYTSPNYTQFEEPRSPPWTDDSPVSVEERLGQKGRRWLGKSRRARNYLFFDIAETVGTEAAQSIQELKMVTPLVELACIYRAFFGNPFSPSEYAELPSADGYSNPVSLTVATIRTEPLRPPSELTNRGQSVENESNGDNALSIIYSDPPMAESKQSEDGGNNFEGDNYLQLDYLQLGEMVEREDPRAGSSTSSDHSIIESMSEKFYSTKSSTQGDSGSAVPQIYGDFSLRGSTNISTFFQPGRHGSTLSGSPISNDSSPTENEMYEDCLAEICSLNSSSPAESKRDDCSALKPSPSSPISCSGQARGDNIDLCRHEDRSAASIIWNPHSLMEPEIQGDGSAESPTSTSSNHSPIESKAGNPPGTKLSSFSTKQDHNWTKGDREALRWLDLAHLRLSPRIPPTMEGPRETPLPFNHSLASQGTLDQKGAVVPQPDPTTKIQKQEHMGWRELVGEKKGANQGDGMNLSDSAVADGPRISPHPVEETKGSPDCPVAVAFNPEKKGKVEPDSSKAQGASERIASTSGQTDQVERRQQTQPQNESSQTAREEPQQIQFIERSGPAEKTYRSDLFGVGFRGVCQAQSPASIFGDDRHHRDSATLFSASSYDGESVFLDDDGEDIFLDVSGVNTADASMLASEVQGNSPNSSATSNAKGERHATLKARSDPIVIGNEDDRYISFETPCPSTPRESNTAKESGFNGYQNSHMSRTSTRPVTPLVTRTPPDSTAAGKKQLDKSTQTAFSYSKSPRTDPKEPTGKYTPSLHSVENSPALLNFAEKADDACTTATGQPANNDPPKASRHRHHQSSPSCSRQDSWCVQDEATKAPCRASQRQVFEGRNRPSRGSNWQPPHVEDADDIHNEKDKSSVNRPVSHAATPRSPARAAESPVEPPVPSAPGPIEEPQDQGLRGDSLQNPANKNMCTGEDGRTAAGRSRPPASGTNEPHPDRTWVPSESSNKRKRQIAEADSLIPKRSCIESPVKERLDGTLTWAMIRDRTAPTRVGNSQTYGPRSLAATDRLLAFLRESIAPAKEHTSFEPVLQQYDDHTGAFGPSLTPGPVYTAPTPLQAGSSGHGAPGGQSNPCPVSTESEQQASPVPENKTNRVHDDRQNAQDIFDSAPAPYPRISTEDISQPCFEPISVAVPSGHDQTEPSGQRPSVAPASMVGTSLSTHSFGDYLTNKPTRPDVTNAEQTTHQSQSMLLCDALRKDTIPATAAQNAAQDACQDAHIDHIVQSPLPSQRRRISGIGGNESLQTNTKVTKHEPASPKIPRPMEVTSIPLVACPLTHNPPVTHGTHNPHLYMAKEITLSDPDLVFSRPAHIKNPEEYTKELNFSQQHWFGNRHRGSVLNSRKRRPTSPSGVCDPTDITNRYTESQGAQGPRKRNAGGPERICQQSRNQIMGPANDTSIQRGYEVQFQGGSGYTNPACLEAPNKRFCLGLDSPRGLRLAPEDSKINTPDETICPDIELEYPPDHPNDVHISASRSTDSFVFIVELVGQDVQYVHHRARRTIRPFLEQHFRLRSKSGNFFNGDLRIIELDPSKSGATHMDAFFERGEVLVFQHTNHNAIDPTKLVRRINQAVSRKKRQASRGSSRHKYKLTQS